MQAPTPVSAYLHSATMVKAGIFLLARLSPVLAGTYEWTHIIPAFGAITMLVGTYLAVTQTDLKAILAYTTISALGTLVLLFGIDTSLSVKAALLFLFVHAFYKAALFMIAGLIDKKAGTRDIDNLGALYKYMPITFVVVLLAALSMAGIPPMLGFLGKELIYEAKVQSPGVASMVLILGVISNVLMVFVSLYFVRNVFLGTQKPYKNTPNEKGLLLLIGPIILVTLSMFFGLFPSAISSLIEPALEIIRLESVEVKLKLWHGFNDVLLLSAITMLLGATLLFISLKTKLFIDYWRALNEKIFFISLSDSFTKGIEYFTTFSRLNTRKIQHGYHRYYVLSIIVFVTVLLWVQLFVTGSWEITNQFTLNPFYISAVVLIIIIAVIYSALSSSRTTIIIAMAVAGYGISVIFFYYSALDLAITQILVETLTVIIFFIILQRLPRFAKLSSKKTKFRDFLIALSFGGAMTLLTLKAINIEFNQPISDFFIENSYAKAFGENVVNVILVDFRAFDTLGEIVVLAIAAIGVYALIKIKKI